MKGREGRKSHLTTYLPSHFQQVIQTPLHELDHRDNFDHLTSLYVPALNETGGFEAFQETVAYLRAPEGCPWDREQTHASLRNTLLEEAYEVLTAIDEDDMEALKEEWVVLLVERGFAGANCHRSRRVSHERCNCGDQCEAGFAGIRMSLVMK